MARMMKKIMTKAMTSKLAKLEAYNPDDRNARPVAVWLKNLSNPAFCTTFLIIFPATQATK
ncbi:hypothetical protein DSECCO2_358140 [anaerobic digester metagenome]